MKIIQVAPFYFPALGGVEEVVKQYAEGLVRNGHEVKVFASNIREPKRLNNVEIEKFSPFKLLKEKADILHLHANKRFTTDAASLINLFKKTPIVFNPHAGQFGATFLGRAHNQTIGRLSFSADLVLTVSEFEKNLILKNGMKPKRLEILPNGVDSTEFREKKKNPFEKFPVRDKKIVLYVGRLNFNKGLAVLIKAINSIPETVLFLIGPDAGEKSNLENLAKELGLEERVFFLGALSREGVIGAYQNADVFCLPSKNEAFGLVVLEAMSAKLPVIASDLEVIKEIIENGKNGLLFRVGDEHDLSDKIISLLKDDLLIKRLVNNGRKTIEEKYRWEEIISKLEMFYKSLI